MRVVCNLRLVLCDALAMERSVGYPSTASYRQACVITGRAAVNQCEGHALAIARKLEQQEKTNLTFNNAQPWDVLEEMEDRISKMVLASEKAKSKAEAAARLRSSQGEEGGSARERAGTTRRLMEVDLAKDVMSQLSHMAKTAVGLGKKGARGLLSSKRNHWNSAGKKEVRADNSCRISKKYAAVRAHLGEAMNEDALMREWLSRVSATKAAAMRGYVSGGETDANTTETNFPPPRNVIDAISAFEVDISNLVAAGPTSRYTDPLCTRSRSGSCACAESE